MIVKKGTRCQTTCCDRSYLAGCDFEPSVSPLICDDITYIRGKCFPCLFQEIADELAEHNILVTS